MFFGLSSFFLLVVVLFGGGSDIWVFPNVQGFWYLGAAFGSIFRLWSIVLCSVLQALSWIVSFCSVCLVFLSVVECLVFPFDFSMKKFVLLK